jgi:thymidine kinase
VLFHYDENPIAKNYSQVGSVPGKIELMMGPMRSNKTAEMLRRCEMRRQYAGQNVMVLKPSDDTKGGPGLVESRNPNGHCKMHALEFQ